MSDASPDFAVPNDRARSLARLRELLWVDPGNEGLWRKCAALAVETADYSALEELARTRLAIDQNNREALFNAATASIGLKRFGDAIAPLAQLLEATPDEPAVLANLALCHYALGQFAEAASYLERGYELGGREAGLLRLLVSSYHHLGRMSEAVEIGGENLEAARQDAALAGVFSLAFLDAGDPIKAARCVAWALKGNPRSIDGLVVQGTLDLGRLDLAAATARFESVAAQVPDNGRAWIGLGTAALLRQDLANAKTTLRRGVTFMPQHVGSWHLLAWTELVSGNLDEAERLFEHALDLDRNFAESHGSLAAVAALRGNSDRATRELEVAKRLDPGCVSAKFAASVLARNRGDAGGADEIIATTVATLTQQNGGPLGALLASLVRR